MPSSDPSFGSASLPTPRPDRSINDATVISRGESSASWSGSATGSIAGGPATTGEIGRMLEGTMLGAYRLDQFIGGGGMGAVFRALDTTLHRTVAVKVLAGRQANDEEMLKRFRNEAQSAARLDHENIGRVHAVGSENGWHFIVFEFIEGTNLRDMIRAEGPFDVARTVDVAMQVADALEHASERDVVHRDIKPSNIVITPAGRARVGRCSGHHAIRTHHDDGAQLRQRLSNPLHLVPDVAARNRAECDQNLRARSAQDLGELVGLEQGIDRIGDACRFRAEQGHEGLRHQRQQEAD